MSRASALAIIAVSCGMLLTGVLAWAQDEEQVHQSCVQACEEVKDQCIDRCDEYSNPVECEGQCQDAAEECLARCR